MESTTADFIIVGGGLTGCVIASRLAQAASSPSVILIEVCPDPTGEPGTDTVLAGLGLLGGKLDYAYQSEPAAQTTRRVHTLPAGRTLGGGSILNYGGWLVADSKDYDAWGKAVGDERWSYAGIKPWLDKTEKHFDVTSISDDPERTYPLRDPVANAWKELGVVSADGSNGSMTGLSELKENLRRDGVRQPSYAAYPLKDVHLFTDTSVKRVTFSEKKAAGVELSDGRTLQANKEVILCAGAYRSPQLLMLSGIGPKETLSAHGIPIIHDSPEVGRNLFDHFAVYMAFRLRDPAKNLALGSPGWTKPSLFKGLPYDWVVSERLPQEVSEKHTKDAALTERNLFEVLTVYVPPGIPGIPIDGTHIATSTMLLLPTSRGTVSIKSASPDTRPSIQPNYLATDFDRDTILYATRRTLKAMLGTETMKQYIASETPPSGPSLDGLDPLTPGASDEAIMERVERSGMQHHHSGGTAAMGKVVDTEGKVLGVEGLRIADASVLPCPLGGHPQASLYAMAEQLASFIVA
ncbi:choline dehydrogenase [Bimuria novae-zelandiae CBS 107.79]|uniref:Choline dehydrogenase n=1 Tax=Bimuria novae-zelandiae CBS 107.79 TaxID=1447943 RepID=A0A6A5V158_9PLEO|nr:choline dehydrogenase [Bimuria novae-zelandiae CBS 107.79]